MIDQYKYTWKMVKPLIPIIFLAIWVVLFEEKIWPDWENEIPAKSFGRGEIQWEYDMNSEQAKENYRFEIIQLTGVADTSRQDTLIIDKTVFCKMENLEMINLKDFYGKQIKLKGRVLGYNASSKKLRLDKCFILTSPGT
jgi:hypothetical protein